MIRRTALLLLAACTLQACGLGPGDVQEGGGATVRVTRDFGEHLVGDAAGGEVRPSDTVMRLLRSTGLEVKTSYGGRFVQSIDGLEGAGSSGTVDWFFYVNGLLGGASAADTPVNPGDVVQWDYHEWGGAMDIFAIVGAFPEPFVHGSDGKRLPTTVACSDTSSQACETVKQKLEDEGVTATSAPLTAPVGEGTARVLVGDYPALRHLRAAQPLEEGPEASGVFARFVEEGGALELLDQAGEPVNRQESLSGLVAATAVPGQGPTWLVTGLDEMGTNAAANTFDGETLRDKFAVAITPADGVVALPVAPDAR